MLDRPRNILKFRLERLLLRGMGYRLALIAALIGLVSLLAGALVVVGEGHRDLPSAIWWAFLRMSDPGYLGDDVGLLRRTVSTVVTILGYVLFMGALVATMVQWLNQTMRNLESGFTPLAQNDHVLVAGWTSRTATILAEMLRSHHRVGRFLERHDARRLGLVVMVPELDAELRFDLRERLGELFDDRVITLRSGTPLRLEHLQRVDFLNAAAILLPSDDLDARDANEADTRIIKTLLLMSSHAPAAELPLAVAEVLDVRRVPLAIRAYAGHVEVVASDLLVGCMLAQSVLYRGLAEAFAELFVHAEGSSLHVREAPDLYGKRFADAALAYPTAVVLGVARPNGKSFLPLLCPDDDLVLAEGDRMVLLAGSDEEASPRFTERRGRERAAVEDKVAIEARAIRVLVLGWSSHVPAVLHELEAHRAWDIEVDVWSVVPPADRELLLETYEHADDRVRVRHHHGDFTLPAILRRAKPATYDRVLMVASDWAVSGEEADARTIVGYLLLRELYEGHEGPRPRVVVELTDAANERLFDQPGVEVLVTPLLVGRLLAQVTLRPELRCVYEELLGLRGAGMTCAPASALGLELHEDYAFVQLSHAAERRGAILLGLCVPSGEGPLVPHLHPAKDSRWLLTEDHRLVLLYQQGE